MTNCLNNATHIEGTNLKQTEMHTDGTNEIKTYITKKTK